MDIKLAEGWDNLGNHDSSYGGPELKTLASQIATLPNITNVNAVPAGIKVLVQKCITGSTTLWITKGIHQRWAKINASGDVKGDADPHIQYKFNYAWATGSRWITGHIFLSESYALTQNYDDGDWDRYEWKTVGVSVTWDGTTHRFPANFSQNVNNIQVQGAGKRGFKRRNSIGLIVPPEFQPPVVVHVPAPVGGT